MVKITAPRLNKRDNLSRENTHTHTQQNENVNFSYRPSAFGRSVNPPD